MVILIMILVTMMMVVTVLVTMVMVIIMWAFSSIVDYSLAHEVGRVRLQL